MLSHLNVELMPTNGMTGALLRSESRNSCWSAIVFPYLIGKVSSLVLIPLLILYISSLNPRIQACVEQINIVERFSSSIRSIILWSQPRAKAISDATTQTTQDLAWGSVCEYLGWRELKILLTRACISPWIRRDHPVFLTTKVPI